MRTPFFPRQLFSILLLLAYLLVGSGAGHALLWCQESETFTHLEYNLSGSCGNACAKKQDDQAPAPGVRASGLLQPSPADCLDSPVSLSHARGEQHPVPDAAPQALPDLFVPIAGPPRDSAVRKVKAALLTLPPPWRALVSLRTVVLLN